MLRANLLARIGQISFGRLGGISARHGVVAACSGAGFLLEYASRVLLARSLGVADFGTLNFGLAIMTVGIGVAALGVPPAAARQIAYQNALGRWQVIAEIIRLSFRIVFGSGLVVALLFGGVYYVAAGSYPSSLMLLLAAIPLLAIVRLSVECLRGLGHLHWAVAAQELIRRVPLLMILGLATFTSLSIGAAAATYLCGGCLTCVACWYLLKRMAPRREIGAAPYPTGELLATSLPLAGSMILVGLNLRIEILLLGMLSEASVVGVYSAALAVSLLLLLPAQVFTFGLMPQLTRLLANRRMAAARVAVRQMSLKLALINLPLTGLTVLFAERIMTLLFGEAFAAGAVALQILAVAHGLQSIVTPFAVALLANNVTQLRFVAYGLGFVLRLGAGLALIPLAGAVGAASAAMFGICGLAVSLVFLLCRAERNYAKD